jgi:hypothetical protein
MRRIVPLWLALLVLLGAVPRHAEGYIYWTDGGALGRADLDGTPDPGDEWLSGAGRGCGVAVDGSHVFWTSLAGTIGRADLDGSEVDPSFIVLPGGTACGVAVDASHVYWASHSSGKIGRAAIDGSSVEASWMSPGVGHGCGIAVDASRVYWATTSGVYSAPVGGGPATAISTVTGENCGVAVNAAHVYWASGSGYIERDVLDGGPPTPIVRAPLGPCGVAVDASHVYWGNSASDSIGRANLDGSGLDQRFAVGARDPCGVAVDALPLPTPSGSGEGGGGRKAKTVSPGGSFRLGRVVDDRRRGTASIVARVPGPGTLLLRGARVRRAAATAPSALGATPAHPGKVEIQIAPRRGLRRYLERNGRARVGVSVTYSPAVGEPATRTARVKLTMRQRPR